MHVTIESANTYFATSFWSDEAWTNASTDIKTKLLATAENDILAYLRFDCVTDDMFPDEPANNLQKAIFEWALFLLKNKETIAKNIGSKLMGVSTIAVEGVGRETSGTYSRRYADAYNDMLLRSPAARFLNAIPRTKKILR